MRSTLTVEKKTKSPFVEGAISADRIARAIASHGKKTTIGAHQIFLGQVRADTIRNKKVIAIEYTAYQSMVGRIIALIRESAFQQFDLECLHIYHSLGIVRSGEICLFVFASSSHRNDASEACQFVVEAIKSDVPVFGKELFGDETYQWKVNK